jgi:hypothetical protein
MSLPERLDPNFWGAETAQQRGERREEAQIGSAEASAASSRASAARTQQITPLEAQERQARLEESAATRSARLRRTEAEADIAETRAAQQREALARTRQLASGRPRDERRAEAEKLLGEHIRRLVQAKEILQDTAFAAGFGAETLSRLGGTPARNVNALLAPIRANTAFGELQKMRQESPTGGALGNVSNIELGLLESSQGSFDLGQSPEQLIQTIDDFISRYLTMYSRVGGDPYAAAEVLGAGNVEQFIEQLQGWRALPEDEQVISRYLNETRRDGTFDPMDYAALMAEAYSKATGRDIDENFINHAIEDGYRLLEAEGDIEAFNYGVSDEDVRNRVLQISQMELPEDMSWGDVAYGAFFNFVPSVWDVAADTVRALTLDLPDTIEGVVKIIGGATGLSEDTEAWDAVKDYYTDRYGSMEGFKEALRNDPGSILADVAGVATGGALIAAKALGTAGRVSRIGALSNAARQAEGFGQAAARLDPLVMTGRAAQRVGSAAAGTASTLATAVPARLAGVTGGEVRQAFDAGRRGSPEFRQQIEGSGAATSPVDQMQAAISDLYQDRSAAYQQRMAKINKSEVLDFADVDAAIQGVRDVGRHRGIDISRAGPVWDEVDQLVGQFRDQGLNSIEDFDAMKRAVGNVRDRYQRGTPEYRVAQQVYGAINDTIVDKAPVYANVMRDYRAASDALSDIQSTLSSGAASQDTVLARLRRKVSGAGATGRRVIDILENTPSGRGLGDAVAGMAMAGTEPAGLVSALSPLAAMTGSPEALLGMNVTPRRVGETAYSLGRKYGMAQDAIGRVADAPPVRQAADALGGLSQRYDLPTTVPQGVRMANPALIQPQVSDYERAASQIELSPEERESILRGYNTYGMPAASTPQIGSGVTLRGLMEQYGSSPSGAPAGVSIEGLAQQYNADAPASMPTGAPTSIDGQIASIIREGVARGLSDEEIEAQIDAAVGLTGFRRGGYVGGRRGRR